MAHAIISGTLHEIRVVCHIYMYKVTLEPKISTASASVYTRALAFEITSDP